MTLTERILVNMNKTDLAELSSLDKYERRYLADRLESVDPKVVPLSEWNDALNIVTGGCHQSSQSSAKEEIIRNLKKAN